MEVHVTGTTDSRVWETSEPIAMQKMTQTCRITIGEPQLWWPSGYGEQPLYNVKVSLCDGSTILDRREYRIGLRTMTISREKDAFGESFAHEVNGVKIFAMGADYIPEDCLLARRSPERTGRLLEDAKAANYNCIRVWGGGHYPDDWFYDLCDELGLIVWQDFMFACAVYDLSEEFEANITAELVDNIRRIRHHACLGLWCGNNEMEQFVNEGVWVNDPKERTDYLRMYEKLFPEILQRHDPDTFYWPASPSSGGGFDEPNDEDRGDTHYWEVWHGGKPFTEYRRHHFRYLSEFGFESFPPMRTIESFTRPEDRNIFSFVMEKHQRNSAGNGKILQYLSQSYLYPPTMELLVYASQLLQAQAMRYGVEHLRRNRGRCMGAVIWQLNDCWPVASWSSIDYYGRWKAVHYYARRFFAPVLLSCEEEGLMTHDANPNAEPREIVPSIRMNVSNETRTSRNGRVRWILADPQGAVLSENEHTFSVDLLSAIWFDRIDLPQADLRSSHVSYELILGDETVSCGSVLFCPPKYYRFEDPHLSVYREGEELLITASAFAKDVEILNRAEDLVLSDNYFDMEPGTRRLRILRGEPEDLQIRSVYDLCR